MSSSDGYTEGSATAAYQQAVDEAAKIAEEKKQQLGPDCYMEIDHLLDAYARRLAQNINKGNSIAARLPSALFDNKNLHFPAEKVERQKRDTAANQAQRQQIEGILDKIRDVGTGAPLTITNSAAHQMKEPPISAKDPKCIEKLTAKIEQLKARHKIMVSVNAYYQEHGTLEGCPDLTPKEAGLLAEGMAQSGQAVPQPYSKDILTQNAYRLHNTKQRLADLATQETKSTVRPAYSPTKGWYFYIGTGQSSKKYLAQFETAKTRFLELREGSADQLILGLERADGLSADILRVCQGQNFLVDDFTRINEMRKDQAVLDILHRVSREIGFDRVQLCGEMDTGRPLPNIPFSEWDNPYFPAATPGSIAAGVYELALRCGAVKQDSPSERSQQMVQLIQLLQSGNRGISHARMMAVVFAADAGPPWAVHLCVDRLMKQFDEYQGTRQKRAVHRRKSKTR